MDQDSKGATHLLSLDMHPGTPSSTISKWDPEAERASGWQASSAQQKHEGGLP